MPAGAAGDGVGAERVLWPVVVLGDELLAVPRGVTIGRIKQIDCRAGDANIAAMAVRADVPRR